MNTQTNDKDCLAARLDAQVNPVAGEPTLVYELTASITKPAFVITFEDPARYMINDQSFQQWVARIDPEDLEVDLPARKSEYPSRDLDRLVTAAIEHGAINGDPRLELTIREGDDDEGAGYYVALHNRSGDQRLTGITSGWNELNYAASDTTPAEQVREYLAAVCDIANVILGRPSQNSMVIGDPAAVNTAPLNIGHSTA